LYFAYTFFKKKNKSYNLQNLIFFPFKIRNEKTLFYVLLKYLKKQLCKKALMQIIAVCVIIKLINLLPETNLEM